MKTKRINLSEIVTTSGTQIRARIDDATVADYAELTKENDEALPPVDVFHDGSEFILADGFHRVLAAARNGFASIVAEIHKGTKADALRFALGANVAHGLKRTNADKRRSVELALAEWPKMSDRQIAEVCAVSDPFVGDVRGQLQTVSSSPAPETRIGADGKERRMPARKPKAETPAPEPATAPSEPEEKPAVAAHTEALGNLKAARAIHSFASWFNMNFRQADERRWALDLIIEEAGNMKAREA